MGKAIIKQPNGKFAIFSSVVDDFICTDCTEDQIVELFVEMAKVDARHNAKVRLRRVKGGKVDGISGKWPDCIETIGCVHGNKRIKEIMEGLDK